MQKLIHKHYQRHKETIHNFIWRSLQIFAKQGITFLIFILCAKLLTPYEFGVYNYALAIIFFLIMFGDFGISTATSKYVAEYNATDKNKLKLILFNSGIIILGLTIIVTILTLIIGPGYLQDKYIYVLWLLPLVFLAPMTSLYDGIYRGLKRFKQLAIISLILGFISLFFVYFLIKQYGLVGALVSQNLFYFILLLGVAFGYKEFHLKWNSEIMKNIGKYSIIVGIGSVGLFLYTRIDIIFLGTYNFINEIAYYEIINKILLILLLPSTIISQIISPTITKYYELKQFSKIKDKFKKYFLFSLLLSLIITFLVFVFYKPIISLIFPQYDLKLLSIIFNLMLIVYFTQILNGIIPTGFAISTGHAKITTSFLVIFGFIHVFLNYLFINLYGFIGIIYSIIITKSTTDIIFLYYYWRKISKLNGK